MSLKNYKKITTIANSLVKENIHTFIFQIIFSSSKRTSFIYQYLLDLVTLSPFYY